MRKLFHICLLLTIMITSCVNEDDATVVAIYAEPSSYLVQSGDKVYIDVHVSTLNSTLTDVSVSSFDPEYGKTEIFQTNPGAKKYKDRIVWEIPSMTSDTTSTEILISATDNAMEYNDLTIKLTVAGSSSVLLQERSGFTLHSPFSGKADAFSLVTLQPLDSASGSEDCDILFSHDENVGTDILPLRWTSGSDVVFCRSNTYDYASASWASVQAVFMNSLRSDHVDELQIDDIILIGREQHAEDGTVSTSTIGAIKIMAIYDEEGSANDRIIFNIKTL